MSEGQLAWAEKMDRFLRGHRREDTEHPKFNYAGQRLVWEPPRGRRDLSPHRGMTARWKSGPPGVLVVCLDCEIRTSAKRGVESAELLRRDVRTWRLRHDRIVKAQNTIIGQLTGVKVNFEKRRADLKNLVEVQGRHGNWNYSRYMCGLYNGLELARSVMEGDQPVFREQPEDGWLADAAPGANGEQPDDLISFPSDPVLAVSMEDAVRAMKES